MKMAKSLELLNKMEIPTLDIQQSVSDLDDAVRNSDNPLKQGVPLQSNNIFVDVINFALENNRDLLYTILQHTTMKEQEFDENTVIQTANIYMKFASAYNKTNSTFQKLLGIFLHSNGLNSNGLQVMSKLGETLSERHLLDTRTMLAVKDEEIIRDSVKNTTNVIVFDNLDMKVKHVLHHKTLPIILSRDIRLSIQELSQEEKTIDEAVLSFSNDFLR